MSTLDVSRLTLDGHPAIREVGFAASDGAITALFGRDDSGASRVLRAIAGLEPAAEGVIRIDGIDVSRRPVEQRRIGLVAPDTPLFAGTVRDNVAFGLRRQDWPRPDRERRTAEVLELVGLAGAERDAVAGLTAGERGRVVLARAIAPGPEALLLDAPTWYVPAVDRIGFRSRLREVLLSLEVPVVIASTDLQDAAGIADEIQVMHAGAVIQGGPLARVLTDPASVQAAELVEYVTLIRGEASGGRIVEPGAGALPLPEEIAGWPAARVMAHPAALLGVPESSGLGSGVSGTVERVRAAGPTHLLDLRVAWRTVTVRWEWDQAPPALDERIGIAVTPGTLRFFSDPAGRQSAPAVRPEDVRPDVPPPGAGPAAASARERPAVAPRYVVEEDTSRATGGGIDEVPAWLRGAPPGASRRDAPSASDAPPGDPHRGMPLD